MHDKSAPQNRHFDFISNGAKKTLLFSFTLLFFFGYASTDFAQFVPLAVIPGLTDIQPTSGGLATFFNNLYKYLIGAAAVLAVIEIIWGGLEISTKDSVSKQSAGKERITQAIFGLVLVLSPVLVFSIINPNILNLSLNLPALDTKSGGVRQTTTQTQPTIVPNSNVGNVVVKPVAYIACEADCTAAQQTCVNDGGSPDVVCLKNGVVDPNGRSGILNYTCIAGETKNVACNGLRAGSSQKPAP